MKKCGQIFKILGEIFTVGASVVGVVISVKELQEL